MKLEARSWQVIGFFFRPYKFRYLVTLILMCLSGALEALNLAALYPVINYGLNLNNKDFVMRHFDPAAQRIIPDNPFLAACVMLVMISFLSFVCRVFYSHYSGQLYALTIGHMQNRIFNTLVSADYDFYIKQHQGKLIYTGTNAAFKAGAGLFGAITLAYQSVNAVSLFSLLLLLEWRATIFISLLGLFYGIAVKQVSEKYVKRCAAVMMGQLQDKNVILNEFITGIKTIKIFLAFKEWQAKHNQVVHKFVVSQHKTLVARAVPEVFIKFLFYLLIGLAGAFFSQRPQQEIIALLPLLGTFAIVVNRFLPSISMIGNTLMNIADSMPDMKTVYALCTQEFTGSGYGQAACPEFQNRIGFENVWFKYDSMNDHLLKGLSFSIEKKKMTAIVGRSGSGKTTIINLLFKLYGVSQGAIKFDGANIAGLDNRSYLSKFGYVSQETFIFNNSIKENIRFGMENCTDAMIEEAAQLANAHGFIMETPQGYDTVVGDAGIKLSGGQRQRIAIARALLRKPDIIVFDEGTSSLDNISEKRIQKAINDISKHATVLIIAHRLSTVQNADKIIILDKGEIKEEGTHEELLKNKDLYYDLYTSAETVEGELDEAQK